MGITDVERLALWVPRMQRRCGTCPLKAETDRHTRQFRSDPEPSRQLEQLTRQVSLGVVAEGRQPGQGIFTPHLSCGAGRAAAIFSR